jgi:serine/threonine protein kinase
MARFEREARVLASLSHPNIAAIYGIEAGALILELVEGPTLAERIAGGPLPLDQALAIARQVAEALRAAHERSVIHRDLKPANVKVTPDGNVKVLDFGLAKIADHCPPDADPVSSPTITMRASVMGMIMGTAGYMAPEQARGDIVDKRADIWAFGVVLYEMLTGQRVFSGDTVSDTLAAVLKSEPDWSSLPPETPLEILRLLRRCLERDRKRRLHDIADARIEIDEALARPEAPTTPDGKKQSRLAWIAAAGLMLLGAVGGWQLSHVRNLPDDNPVVRFQLQPPEGSHSIAARGLAVSPDGKAVVFSAVAGGGAGLWFRPLDDTHARLLPGTADATSPFWSPDSKSVAFFSSGTIRVFDLLRGTSSKICEVTGVPLNAAWASDGRIVFSIRDAGLFQVAASGGTPSQFIALDHAHGESNQVGVQILPDGQFLYQGFSTETGLALYAAPLREPSRRVRLVSTGLTLAHYVRDKDGKDYLLWNRGTTLVAQQLDMGKLQLIGDSFSLADPVAAVSVGGGVLVYASSGALMQFRWFDRAGKAAGILGEPGNYAFCRISSDGRRVVTTSTGSLLLMETVRGVSSRLTSTGIDISPVWSPDAHTILFAGGTPFNLFRISADGTGSEERVLTSEWPQKPTDWSSDGRLILYNAPDKDRVSGLWTLEVTREGRPRPGAKPQPYIRTPFNQTAGRFSPDMRWVAYQSDESGKAEVYVQSFPEPREKIRISTTGGRNPEWGAEGRELFYASLDQKLMVVALKLGTASLIPTLPRELLALPRYIPGANQFTVTPDGQRFLVPMMDDKVVPWTVVVNWPALLKKGAAAR